MKFAELATNSSQLSHCLPKNHPTFPGRTIIIQLCLCFIGSVSLLALRLPCTLFVQATKLRQPGLRLPLVRCQGINPLVYIHDVLNSKRLHLLYIIQQAISMIITTSFQEIQCNVSIQEQFFSKIPIQSK